MKRAPRLDVYHLSTPCCDRCGETIGERGYCSACGDATPTEDSRVEELRALLVARCRSAWDRKVVAALTPDQVLNAAASYGIT